MWLTEKSGQTVHRNCFDWDEIIQGNENRLLNTAAWNKVALWSQINTEIGLVEVRISNSWSRRQISIQQKSRRSICWWIESTFFEVFLLRIWYDWNVCLCRFLYFTYQSSHTTCIISQRQVCSARHLRILARLQIRFSMKNYWNASL